MEEKQKTLFEIIQPNRVTHAKYDFTSVQEDALTIAIDAIQKHMTGEKSIKTDLFKNPIITIDVAEIAQKNNKNYVFKELTKMRKKDIEYEWERPSDGRTVKTNTGIFGAVHDVEGTSLIEVEISKWAIPWMVYWGKIEEGNNGGFTKFLKSTALILQGEHTKRIYKMCCRWGDKGGFTMSIDEFKEWLQISDKYPNSYDLKKRVLEPAKEELKEKSDICFEYKLEKVKSRKANFIRFKINKNAEYEPLNKMSKSDLYVEVYNKLCKVYDVNSNGSAMEICDTLSEKGLLKPFNERLNRLDDQLVNGKLEGGTNGFNMLVKWILKEDYNISY